jgi:hypothetical protein
VYLLINNIHPTTYIFSKVNGLQCCVNKKISSDEYYKLFTTLQESGLSKVAFTSEAGISRVSFNYRCRTFEGQLDDYSFASFFCQP